MTEEIQTQEPTVTEVTQDLLLDFALACEQEETQAGVVIALKTLGIPDYHAMIYYADPRRLPAMYVSSIVARVNGTHVMRPEAADGDDGDDINPDDPDGDLGDADTGLVLPKEADETDETDDVPQDVPLEDAPVIDEAGAGQPNPEGDPEPVGDADEVPADTNDEEMVLPEDPPADGSPADEGAPADEEAPVEDTSVDEEAPTDEEGAN